MTETNMAEVRRIGPCDHALVGTYEAALILGVERSRLAKWLVENEHGKNSIEPPTLRLKCGPIWSRDQIDRKLRSIWDELGRPGFDAKRGDEELAFQKWALRRQRARAKREGIRPKDLEKILGGQQLAEAA